MPAKIIGLERLDYFSRKSNKQVRGYKFHLAEPLTKDTTAGVQVYSEFLHDENAPGFAPTNLSQFLGREVVFFYNRYQTATGCEFVAVDAGKGK